MKQGCVLAVLLCVCWQHASWAQSNRSVTAESPVVKTAVPGKLYRPPVAVQVDYEVSLDGPPLLPPQESLLATPGQTAGDGASSDRSDADSEGLHIRNPALPRERAWQEERTVRGDFNFPAGQDANWEPDDRYQRASDLIEPRISQRSDALSELPLLEPEPQEFISPADDPEAPTGRDDLESIQPLRDFTFDAVFAPRPQGTDYFQSLVPANATGRDPHTGVQEPYDYHWAARNVSHRTLYFQDLPLERYGYSYGPKVQPFVSALDFVRDVAMAPIRWGKEQRCELHYVLGYERAGSCAPPVCERWIPSR